MDELIQYLKENPAIIVGIIAAIVSIISAVISGIFGLKSKTKEAELKIELDKATALNERLTYTQNRQFEYEFKVYKDLSKQTISLTSVLHNYLHNGMQSIHSNDPIRKENAKELLKATLDSCNEFHDVLTKSAPFISEPLYEQFEKFWSMCDKQYSLFFRAQYYEDYECQSSTEGEACDRDEKIHSQQSVLIKLLRTYLSEYNPSLKKR